MNLEAYHNVYPVRSNIPKDASEEVRRSHVGKTAVLLEARNIYPGTLPAGSLIILRAMSGSGKNYTFDALGYNQRGDVDYEDIYIMPSTLTEFQSEIDFLKNQLEAMEDRKAYLEVTEKKQFNEIEYLVEDILLELRAEATAEGADIAKIRGKIQKIIGF